MPRRSRDKPNAGESDSFLDIVANIVGILIILIVIVGVRVGQSTRAITANEDSAPRRIITPGPVVAPRPIHQKEESDPAPAPLEADPQLLAAIEETTAAIDALGADSRAAAEKSEQLAQAVSKLRGELSAVSADRRRLDEALAATDRAWQAALTKKKRLAHAAGTLQEKLSDVPSENVKIVRHELNPIGESVRGEEMHFRLAEGRVSRVPLETFIRRLKVRIDEKKEWIARMGRHEGLIGPYDGYTMKYVIERAPLTLADELGLGRRMIRIQVTGWKVIPQETLRAETVEEALAASSRFRQALRLASYDTTLTFWVYPDSFASYRKLKEFAHGKGFEVAARPLPPKVPIAGSPQGSRSRSQ